MSVVELEGVPIPGFGSIKYTLRDIALDMRVENGDVVTVTGIPGLAQHIEIRVLTADEYFERVRRPPAREEREDPPNTATRPPQAWVRPSASDVVRRLGALMASDSGQFFEEVSAARIIGDDLEVEFRATGYPGSYLHRVALDGRLAAHEVVALPKATIFAVDRINDAVLDELAADPLGLDRLHDREFEHIVARLIERMGYEVELTGRGGDDGVDIFAIRRDGLSPCLTVIDCKRYARDHRFGPAIVRAIAGVRDQHNASVGMIVTTARFTDGARDLQREKWPWQVALADSGQVMDWIRRFGWEHQNGVWRPGG